MQETITGAVSELSGSAVEACLGLEEESVEQMVRLIGEAGSVFVMGAGLSGLIGSALAMRLMHLGYKSYVVGDVTTPDFSKDDVAIVISHSGQTPSLIVFSQKVKDLGGRLILLTARRSSPLGGLSDCTIVFNIAPKKAPLISGIGDYKHENASGTLFGADVFLFVHGLILYLVERSGRSPEEIDGRHANLQ